MKSIVKPKMLYMMIVDWAWIKQRPHFMAEEMAKRFDLLVLYPFLNRRKGLQKKNPLAGILHMPIFTIPMGRRIPLINPMNVFFQRLFVWLVMRLYRPDYIWISHPSTNKLMPHRISGKVIYDCMDDYAAMAASDAIRQDLLVNEKHLVANADYLMVSSNELKMVFLQRYSQLESSRVTIVRNGFDGKLIEPRATQPASQLYKIAYVGTISHWFDWDVIQQSLDAFSNIEYHLIGPVDASVSHINHPRLHVHGTIEHAKLYDTVCGMDCMCMPFMLNDIIKSVDPVKLYEYINYGKNILCVRYEEIQRFEPFVYFYSDYEEYAAAIRKLITQPQLIYSDAQRTSFLGQNSWKDRGAQVEQLLFNPPVTGSEGDAGINEPIHQ